MRKKVLLLIAAVITVFTLNGCFVTHGFDLEDVTVEGGIDDIITDGFTYEDYYYDDGGIYGTGSTALRGERKAGRRRRFSPDGEATVMVYLNGSDLEESYRSATDDILEMIDAKAAPNVNIVIQTGGTSSWHIDGIRTEGQRFVVREGKLYKIDDSFGTPDMTKADTLSDFIGFCRENYPADRNILILWDHGCGPVEGFGYDTVAEESDALTLDEMQTALSEGGVYFDFIGFDACVMAAVETAAALCDYADYMIFSQDYESISGWDYAGWLKELSGNMAISTEDLSKMIIDEFVRDSRADEMSGILSMVDMYAVKELYAAWEKLLFNNSIFIAEARPETEYNISDRAPARKDGILSIFEGGDALADYSLVDAAQVARLAGGEDGKALLEAIDMAVIYSAATEEDEDFCGLNVALPFENEFAYSVMEVIYPRCGFSQEYISIMKSMV